MSFLKDTAPVTYNGPYGQADWVRTPQKPFKDCCTNGGTTNTSMLQSSSTRYAAINGAAFGEVILLYLFGYQPKLGDANGLPELWRAAARRADLSGRLDGLRLPNGTHVTICLEPNLRHVPSLRYKPHKASCGNNFAH